jgi:hypothetical protein
MADRIAPETSDDAYELVARSTEAIPRSAISAAIATPPARWATR